MNAQRLHPALNLICFALLWLFQPVDPVKAAGAIPRGLTVEAFDWDPPVRLPHNSDSPNLLRESLADTRPANLDRLEGAEVQPLPARGDRPLFGTNFFPNTGPFYGPASAFDREGSVHHLPQATLLTPAADSHGVALGIRVSQTGQYLITGTFARTQPRNLGNGVSVSVLRNLDTTNMLFAAELGSSFAPTIPQVFEGPATSRFALLADLEADDVVRFVVFNGVSGNDALGDETALECLVVAAPVANAALVGQRPVVAEHPDNVTAIIGSDVSIHVRTFGGEVHWEQSHDQNLWTALADGGPFSGTGTDTLTVRGVAAAQSGYYRARLFSDSWPENVFSEAARLIVTLPRSAFSLTRIAGFPGEEGLRDSEGLDSSSARLSFPSELAVRSDGMVLVTEQESNAIREINPAGGVSVFAGSLTEAGSRNGPLATARFVRPGALAFSPGGILYVAEPEQGTVRRIADGEVTLFAGQPGNRGHVDGPRETARLGVIAGIAADAAGNVFVSDPDAHVIRRIAPDGTVSTVAGGFNHRGTADGRGTAARFGRPYGLSFDGMGNLLIVDRDNHSLRRMSPDGEVTTLAGMPGRPGAADGPVAEALFRFPRQAVADPAGLIYLTDTGNHLLRLVIPGGDVYTVGWLPGAADSGPSLYVPSGLGLDWLRGGTLYFANAYDHTVQKAERQSVSAPWFVRQPASHRTGTGGVVTFSALAQGVINPTCQWRKDGVALPGATDATLTLTDVAKADAGAYTVVASNPGGAVISQPAQLQVVTPGELTGSIVFSYREPGNAHYDLWQIQADGNNLVNLTHTPTGSEFDPAVNPGGTRLAYTRLDSANPAEDGIYVLELAAGAAPRLLVPRAGFPNPGVNTPVWLNDDVILFAASAGAGDGVWEVPAEGGAARLRFPLTSVLPGQVSAALGDLSPDGKRLLLIGEEGTWAPRADVFSVQVDGTDGRTVWQDPPLDDWRDVTPRWSPDGTQVAFTHWFTRGANKNPEYMGAALVRPDGTDFRWLTPSNHFSHLQDWSPDGRSVLYLQLDYYGLNGSGNLWVTGTDGRNPRQLTFLPGEFPWFVFGRQIPSPQAQAIWLAPALPTAPQFTQSFSDPPGNLVGDASRAFMDITSVSWSVEGANYLIQIRTAAAFPSREFMGADKRFDFIWFVDADQNAKTGQSADGNDYNIHLYLDGTGWHPSWYKVSPVAAGDGVTIDPQAFEIRISGNVAALVFPRSYLPTAAFDFWASCFNGNSPNWPPLTSNPLTAKASFLAADLPPLIVTGPRGQTVALGSSVSLGVAATSPSPLAYQWRLNGVALAGATNAELTLPSVTLADGGSYTVVVANGAGSVESVPALLEIEGLPALALVDNFAVRQVFTETSFVGVTNNLTATGEPGESRHAGKAGGKSLWLTWWAPADGVATFRTTGSGFDTLLAVYTGTSLGGLVEVASDEDRGGFLTGEVHFNAVAGTEYQIAVDGFAGAAGTVVLGWELDAAAPVLPVISTEGQPADALAVAGQGVSFQVSAGPAGVSYQWSFNGTPLAGANAATLSLPAVTPAQAGSYRVRVSTPGGAFVDSRDALLEVRTGTAVGAEALSTEKLADLFADDPAEAGAGRAGRPGRNGFTSPSVGVPGTRFLNLAGSLSEPGDPVPCDVLVTASRWLRFRAATPGTVIRVVTTNAAFDTVLAVFTNRFVPKLVACNDDYRGGPNSRVDFTAEAGVDYLVMVAAKGGASGVCGVAWLAADGVTADAQPGLDATGLEDGHFTFRRVVPPGVYQLDRGATLNTLAPLQQLRVRSGLLEYRDPEPASGDAQFYRFNPAP